MKMIQQTMESDQSGHFPVLQMGYQDSQTEIMGKLSQAVVTEKV
jgi:hypothetical protein